MKKGVFKYILYFLSDILYLISSLTPKDKRLWVFGAMHGRKYGDNSRHLFEYISDNRSEIKAVWLTRNKKVMESVRAMGYRSHLAYGLKGFLLSLRAKIAVISYSRVEDINPFALSGRTKVVQLWHGIAIKYLAYDYCWVPSFWNPLKGSFSNFKTALYHLLFPALNEDYSLVVASSEANRSILSVAFRMPPERIAVTGYPRNDVLLRPSKRMHEKTWVLYAPTIRGNYKEEKDLFELYGFDARKISESLSEMNAELLIKVHPHLKADYGPLKDIGSTGSVRLLDIDDVNEILPEVDILIADYSGIQNDFLLLERPMIFAAFDIESYLGKKGFYYDYEEVTPGPKAKNWDDVLVHIKEAIENPSLYEKDRERVKAFFHAFTDGRNCERVFDEIVRRFIKEP